MFQKKFFCCLILIGLLAVRINAQTKPLAESVIPPAPTAAELGKYGTYPVGLQTGLPDISFPMYAINTGKLQVPITLSYHASGIKVNQNSTDVGMGWSIFAGGSITRNVYGYADESFYGYFNYDPPSLQDLHNIDDFDALHQYCIWPGPGKDVEPDLFVYNLGGRSGKFVFRKNKQFATIPYDPIKINKGLDIDSKLIFTLVDENGVIYEFNKYSYSLYQNVNPDMPFLRATYNAWYLTRMISYDLTDTIHFLYENNAMEDGIESHEYPIGVTRSLGLGQQPVQGPIKTVTSPTTYNELLLKEIKFRNGIVHFNRNTVRKDGHLENRMLDEMLVYNNNNQLVKKISFNHDYFYATPFYDTWQHHRLKLTGFVESGTGGTIGKAYAFDYNSTALPPKNSYSVDYWGYYNGQNNINLIPRGDVYGYQLSTVNFSDGTSHGNFYSPENVFTIGDANREPSEANMQAAVLNKITYPTGGNTVFNYEAHKYTSDDYIKQEHLKGGTTTGIDRNTKSENVYTFSYPSDPGLPEPSDPIADLNIYFSTTNMTNSILGEPQEVVFKDLTTGLVQTWKHTGDLTIPQTINVKQYLRAGRSYELRVTDYGDPATYITCTIAYKENTSDHVIKIGGGLRIASMLHYSADNTLASQEQYVYGLNESGIGVKLFDERKFYKNYEDNVSAYFESVGPLSGNCGMVGEHVIRTYQGLSSYSSINYSGCPVLYPSVAKYAGTQVSNIGKTVSNFTIYHSEEPTPFDFVNSGNYGSIGNAWNQAELDEEAVFKNENNQYIPVTRSIYDYDHFNQTQEYAVQIKQYKHVVKLQQCGLPSMDPYTGGGAPGLRHFTSYQYAIKTGASRKSRETNKVYGPSGLETDCVTTITDYNYLNPAHLYPSTVTTNVSNGTQKISKLFYTQDLSSADASGMLTALSGKNVLTIPVRTESYRGATLLEADHKLFNNTFTPNPHLIQKASHSLYDRTLTEVRKVNYMKYDAFGNPLERTVDGNAISNIYDYNYSYPVCEVKNASSVNIAYSSFEADGTGNWNVAGAARSFGGVTGSKCYSLSNGSITKTDLTATTKYNVSYWSTGGMYTVTGTIGNVIAGKSILMNGKTWTCYQHEVSGITSVTVSGGGLIDELRLHPFSAIMQTEVFDPLIGVTAACDARNTITYYEYDGLNRLAIIRDQDRNVAKRICYNYHGQPGACTVFGNDLKTVTLAKNNCSSGGVGSLVTYTVPANTYFSTQSAEIANQLAQKELDANAQQHANDNGNCTWVNDARSGTFTRTDCPAGTVPTSLTYTINAGTYSSTISKEDANNQAQNAVNNNGQGYVNANAVCKNLFVSLKNGGADPGVFNVVVKNTAGTVLYGQSLQGELLPFSAGVAWNNAYIIEITSTVPMWAIVNGVPKQVHATTSWTVGTGILNIEVLQTLYFNVATSGTFTRNNCPAGQIGATVIYPVNANTYYSTSQADANQQAQNDVNANGQNYANQVGQCSTPQVVSIVLRNSFFGSAPPNPITVSFLQNGNVVQTNNFPTTSTGTNTISLPAGSYTMRFTLPSGFGNYPITYLLAPGGGQWSGGGGSVIVNTGTVTFNFGTSYTITASNVD